MENLINEIRELRLVVEDIHTMVVELKLKNDSELMTITAVMERLRVSRSTIERYISSGILDVVRVGKGSKRYINRSLLEQKINDGLI